MSDIEGSAIHNAIELFTKTKPKIYKDDSVFHVTFTDSIFRLVFWETPQPNKERISHKWVRGTFYDNLNTVSISGSSDFQYFLTSDIKAGKKAKIIPTHFIEIDGKLFLWNDDDYPITEELLDALHRYNLFVDYDTFLKNEGLPDDIGIIILDNPVDDSKKGINYFFCKNNLTIYKKVISSSALGYFDIPKIKCK